MIRRGRNPFLVLVLLLGSCGCGNSHGIYPVTGSVTYNGAPAAGAFIFLLRPGGEGMNDPSQMGVVKADGSFTIVCGSLGEGCMPGEYDVLIKWPQDPGRHKQPKVGQNHLHSSGEDQLRGRYADPKHPRLHVVVRAEANSLPVFDLTERP